MRLTKLTLFNFGRFSGEVQIPLNSGNNNLQLFTGNNGAGKSTILNAIQICIYGPQSLVFKRGFKNKGTGYKDFLKSLISFNVSANRAFVELEAYGNYLGLDCTFSFKRLWDTHGSELFEVYRNHEFQADLTEAWASTVNSFFPQGLSKFFIFDGEQIEEWSDWHKTQESFTEAIFSVLGVDVIEDTLRTFRTILSDSVAKTTVSLTDDQSLEELRKALNRDTLLILKTEAANLYGKIERLRKKIADEDLSLTARNEELAKGSSNVFLELAEKKVAVRELESKRRTLTQRRKTSLHLIETIKQAVKHRDAQLIEQAPKTIKKNLHDLLVNTNFNFEGINQILFESNEDPNEIQDNLKSLKEDITRIEAAAYEVEKTRLSSTTYDNLLTYKAELDFTERQAKELELEIKKESERLEKAEYILNEAIQKMAYSNLQDKQSDFYISNLKKAFDELFLLKNVIIEDFCRDFTREVCLRFRKLLPATVLFDIFSCSLIEGVLCFNFKLKGQDIDPASFSAGQKQILAISFLASFFSVSKRDLPIIIDTPLARLDTNNTKTFCTSFLNELTNQGLILATDKESSLIKSYIPNIAESSL